MKPAREWFGVQDRERIAHAIAEAERKSAGEIVPVVAAASEDYGRAEGLGGIVLALTGVTVGWLAWQRIVPATGEWTSGYEPRLGLWAVLAMMAGGYVAGAWITRRVPGLRRILAGRRRMRDEVTRAAAAAFERFHVRRTRAATGVVIYVSLFERMTCVLGDRMVAEKFRPEDWREVCDDVTRGLREGRPVEALVQAIARCGDLLSKHFPPATADANELSNELHLLE